MAIAPKTIVMIAGGLLVVGGGFALAPTLGDMFTAADIQLSFVAELANYLGSIADYPRVSDWLKRLTARPAFKRSIVRGGAYGFAFDG